VTDQGSQESTTDHIVLPALAPPVTIGTNDPLRLGVPHCIFCGRPGRFVNPFENLRGT
jgi:hypothetical protein